MFFGSVHPLDPMVFEPTTIEPDGFSMVANHWSNECIKLVTMDRWGLFVIILPVIGELEQTSIFSCSELPSPQKR